MEREAKLLKFKSSIRNSQQATMKREARETRLQKIAEFAAGDSAAANQVPLSPVFSFFSEKVDVSVPRASVLEYLPETKNGARNEEIRDRGKGVS